MIVLEGAKYFFAYIDAVPPQFATPTLSLRHLTVLLFLIGLFTVLTLIFKDKDRKMRTRYVRVLASMLLFFNLLNELWLVSVGHFTITTELPLQLCGVMYIIIPLMTFTHNQQLREFVYACGMPGAFLAMLSPTIQGYYFMSWGFLMFMVMHSLIVYIPSFMLITGEFRPRLRNLTTAASMFVCLVLVDLIVDYQLHSNYLYLRWAPRGTLLETFASWAGTPGYIFIAIFVVIVVWILLYLPWEIFYRTQQRQVLSME